MTTKSISSSSTVDEPVAPDVLLSRLDRTRSVAQKRALVEAICRALNAQMQVEEELVYPALAGKRRHRDLLDQLCDRHATLRRLIAEVQGAESDDELEADVSLIAAEVQRHAALWAQHAALAGGAERGFGELGAQIATRRRELLASAEQFGGWD